MLSLRSWQASHTCRHAVLWAWSYLIASYLRSLETLSLRERERESKREHRMETERRWRRRRRRRRKKEEERYYSPESLLSPFKIVLEDDTCSGRERERERLIKGHAHTPAMRSSSVPAIVLPLPTPAPSPVTMATILTHQIITTNCC